MTLLGACIRPMDYVKSVLTFVAEPTTPIFRVHFGSSRGGNCDDIFY